ncbi:MAG: hypothetical protein QRY16_04915 [Enterobacterales bacterium endosymbiont of Blomia tropicalis]|uniref:hypothetical protein n=1 Tax=Mixta mediterraneensis TaxID=2758443 RepID=UPI001874A87A|nr:hypothetical protein [Mixta mediterraneensis]MBE5253726.1 hypothetical protein [Mixta mediterraneensis]MDL4913156.1 hypothetical protein [Mixta mediterraneensis]
MTFLKEAESGQLLKTLEGDGLLIALLCPGTGARWGETSTLPVSIVVTKIQ